MNFFKSLQLVLAVSLLALVLGGCGSDSSTSTDSSGSDSGSTAAATDSTAKSDKKDSSLDAGRELFVSNCAGCHALADADASGTPGPNLDDLQPKASAVIDQVNKGGNGMPSFSTQLSGDEITSIGNYVAAVAGK